MSRLAIKICGIRSEENASACERCGVEFLGFIFHKFSSRYITPEVAASVKTKIVQRVGVFTTQSSEKINEIAKQAKLDKIQLHGNQDINFCKQFAPEQLIKVFWPKNYASVQNFQNDLEKFAPYVDYFLLDAGKSGGGSGQTVNLDFIEKVNFPRPIILAGGLGSLNILEVVEKCSPWGIDLNSGVEFFPGEKNIVEIEKILEKLSAFRF